MREKRKLYILACSMLIACLLLLQSCAKKPENLEPGKSPAPPKKASPSEVFSLFQKSLVDEKFDTAFDLITLNSKDRFAGSKEFATKTGQILQNSNMLEEIRNTKVLGEEINGDTATVTIEFPYEGNPDDIQKREVKLVKEEDEWRIEFLGD